MIDEDELAGQKSQKTLPVDTSKRLPVHQNKTQSTGSVGKLNIMDWITNFMQSLRTADSGMGRYITPWEMKSIPSGTTYNRTVGCIETAVQGLATCRARGIYYYPDQFVFNVLRPHFCALTLG